MLTVHGLIHLLDTYWSRAVCRGPAARLATVRALSAEPQSEVEKAVSDATNGRGIASDDFDDDEIEWDDEEGTEDDSDGLSPIEGLVGDAEDFVGGTEHED